MKTQMTNFLEENIGVQFCDFSIGNSLLDMVLKSQATKEKKIYIYILGLLKIKNFCASNITIKKWKGNPQKQQNIQPLIRKCEDIQVNNEKINKLNFLMGQRSEYTFLKRGYIIGQ